LKRVGGSIEIGCLFRHQVGFGSAPANTVTA
jgi:hypothetical protein